MATPCEVLYNGIASKKRGRNRDLSSVIVRAAANSVVLVGLFLLVRVLYKATTGSSVVPFFVQQESLWIRELCALALNLPVPFHVIAVGLVVQRKWLSRPLARAVWLAVAVSGSWLGVALGVRLLASR
jgi:hypothetical protein